MTTKRRAIILVAIAVILVIASFAMMASDSSVEEVGGDTGGAEGSGRIGIDILPPQVEDRLENKDGK